MKQQGLLIDMDGVIYRGSKILPGGKELIQYLQENDYPFLFLTNNSKPTPRDIQHNLTHIGITVGEDQIYTSAMATARFIGTQNPLATAYVLGEGGLLKSLHDNGIAISEKDPDFVVVGEGRTLTLEMVEKAVDFIIAGSRLIATNLDPAPLMKGWTKPGTGAIIAMLEEATGSKAFSIGKPSPIMMRFARKALGLQTSQTIMVGDTMETDVLGGISMGYQTILTLTGNAKKEDIKRYPYNPTRVVENVGKVISYLEELNVTKLELSHA